MGNQILRAAGQAGGYLGDAPHWANRSALSLVVALGPRWVAKTTLEVAQRGSMVTACLEVQTVSFQRIPSLPSLRESRPRDFRLCSLPAISGGCLLARELCLTLLGVNDGGSSGLQEKCEQPRGARAGEAAPANNFRSSPSLRRGCPRSPR